MPLSDQQERTEAVGDQLRAKVASKFAASTFLAGFAATILAAFLPSLWQQDATVPVHYPRALGAAMAATVLFVLGVVRLDELSMPKRFWRSTPDARRVGPDVGLLGMEDLWAIHDQMVYFWSHLTLTGTALTGFALLLLLVPQPHVASVEVRGSTFWWSAAAAAASGAYGIWRANRAPHRNELVRPVD
jgi:hypothetical protein